MARIQSEIINKAIDDLKLDVARDKIPNETEDKVQITYELRDFKNKTAGVVRNFNTASTTGGLTVYNVVADENFYLTSAFLGVESDATADNTNVNITATIDGTARIILGTRKLTATAGKINISLSFPYPIKVDSNTTIVFINTFTVGVSASIGGITGISDVIGATK
ncbi:MAG: hypothetical protein FD167_2691 [bacterium]|nr:MAG: hypothetical protein FD167_2691 [bacterium]